MSTINRFEDLEIWALSVLLAKEIFGLTKITGLSKNFALKDQLEQKFRLNNGQNCRRLWERQPICIYSIFKYRFCLCSRVNFTDISFIRQRIPQQR